MRLRGSIHFGKRCAIPPLHFMVASLLALTFFLESAHAIAGDLGTVKTFNIPSQPLDRALLEFGVQAHVQLSISLHSIKSEPQTRALKGSYTGKEALAALLDGTGLHYAVHGLTVEIRPAARARASSRSTSLGQFRTTSRSTPSAKEGNPSVPAKDPPTSQRQQQRVLLREVIVTAQKYSQRTFNVPINLDVITGAELQEHGITDLSNLVYDVPGLYMNNTGTTHAVYIRGVADLYGSGALVGQYIDDADITAEGPDTGDTGLATGDGGLYDLNRVEVLKGPQGTLYGDSSMGGVIRYITNKPDLDRYQAGTDAVAQFTEYGAPGQRIETMLNTPLVDGSLGLRLAGLFEHDGGWIDEPAANLKNVNGSNLVDVRAEVLWRPTSAFTLNAMQTLHRHSYGIGSGEDASGNLTPLFGTALAPNAAENSSISNITLTYDLGFARLLNSSTYLKDAQDIYDEFNAQTIGALTYWFLNQHDAVSATDFNDEIRLVHAGAGAWQWTVGGFYNDYRYSDAENEYIGAAGATLASAFYLPAALNFSKGTSTSWAAFANTSYRIFDRLTVGAGVRYFSDRETEVTLAPYPYPAPRFTSTDPRFFLQYHVSRNINAYASASKGFRSGGRDGVINGTLIPPYQPETLWSYDLGTKMRFPRRALRADVDLFYMNYSNFITARFFPSLGVASDANAGNARIKGVDADVEWQALANWRASLNAETLDTEFLTATAVSGYAPGERLPFAPRYSFTASIRRSFEWNRRTGDVEVYYYELSRVQSRALGFPLGQSDVMHFLNARIDIHWAQNLRLALFMHNLLNDRGLESPSGPLFGLSARPRPRTFGVEFDCRFL
jgi:iron complex outermembrane receptor protein